MLTKLNVTIKYMFCLPLEQTKKFIQALKDGAIDPAKLADMSSAERHDFFEKIVGAEDAREVNAQFESKLLLKNQQQGMVNWAKKITGITETVRRDIISKIEKMDKVLDADSQKTFLEDLASKKLGTDVSFEEAKKISSLSKQVTESKAKIKETDPIGSSSRLEYGSSRVALQNYVNELKLSNAETTIKSRIADFKANPATALMKGASDVAGFAKGVKASLDNSALFRQGWKTLFTHPTTWAQNAAQTFVDMYKQLKLKPTDSGVLDGIKAEVYSRPNALDGTYQKMKLDIGSGEEAFPTTLPEKIPLFNRLYKASETAYNGFLMRMRADIADKYIQTAKENGVDLTNKIQLESIGKLVNSLTGRGYLGSLEKIGKTVNTILFSPKMIKSNLDFLTAHQLQRDVTPFVRKQAAINLVKVVTGVAGILTIAKTLNPESVDTKKAFETSSDFGKIKSGNTRFDVSGGMGSLVVLAARLAESRSKSSTSGRVTELNSGKFGSQTKIDVVKDYFLNKLSPAASVVKELMEGRDFNGNKPTLRGEAKNLAVPLPITNAMDTFADPKSANDLLVILADALGISTNTYSSKKK